MHMQIRLSPIPQECAVVVDGEDVTARWKVAALRVGYDVRDKTPRVVLEVRPESIDIEGEDADLQLRSSLSVEEFLDSVDPQEIENAMLELPALGNKGDSTAGTMLALLKELANG